MRRLLTGSVLGLMVVLLGMGPASAAPPREDAAGDAISPKGDILVANYTVSFSDEFVSKFKFKVQTNGSSDPVTSNAWHNTNTEIRAFIDVTGANPGPDYVVTLSAEGAGPFTFVATFHSKLSDQDIACGATAVFVAPRLYKGVVPGACFFESIPTQARARFEMTWDTPPAGGTQGTDKSPDSGWGPFLHAA